MSEADDRRAAGARNLLLDCAGFRRGDALLIVHEDPALGWYDAAAPMTVAETARSLGMTVDLLEVGAPACVRDETLRSRIDTHQNVVFFARIGDQDRFETLDDPEKVRVMSYIRSADMLASDFGCMPHKAMAALKGAVNSVLLDAQQVRITCPRGTQIEGTVSPDQAADGDVSVRRFPLGVPIPLLADRFSGEVVLADYLTPTGSKVYDPASVALAEPVIADVKEGRIAGFRGREDVVERVRTHYAHVADRFGIDRDCVHSWHAGIHPGLVYDSTAAADPDRWSNTVFVSPGYLHFHTCGAYPPGEICWMIADPTVEVDGVKVWNAGRLCVEKHPQTSAVLDRYPELERRIQPVD